MIRAAFRPIPRCSLPVRAVKSEPVFAPAFPAKPIPSVSPDLTARLRQAETLLWSGWQPMAVSQKRKERTIHRQQIASNGIAQRNDGLLCSLNMD